LSLKYSGEECPLEVLDLGDRDDSPGLSIWSTSASMSRTCAK
jgi:hypothetical protein